jgi:hypothetical protein
MHAEDSHFLRARSVQPVLSAHPSQSSGSETSIVTMTELELLKKTLQNIPLPEWIDSTRTRQAMIRYSVPLLALGLLAGCARAPTLLLKADDPANPSTPEAAVRPFRNALGIDGLTKKSRLILGQAAKQQQQWDQSGPDSGDQQGEQMKNMPGTQMPLEQPSPSPQDKQMPGMQMAPEPSPNSQ